MHKNRPILKWLALICFILFLALGALTIRAALWLTAPDLNSRVATALTKSLGRKVTLGALRVEYQNPLVLEISDLHIANASWGSAPNLLQIGRLTAEIVPQSLWLGRIEYRNLTIDNFDMLLERNKNGVGNWRFDDQPAPIHAPHVNGGIALIPKNRTQFPILINMQLRHGLVRYRTSSGKILDMAANDFTMNSSSADAPVHLLWDGSYNHIPAVMQADMASYTALRDGARPYPMHLTISLSKSKLDFNGTMMNPLDADGATGQLQITTSKLGEVLAMMGMDQPSALTLSVTGPFTRDGDHWRWHHTDDHLADNDFTGDLALDEGARGQPDTIGFNLMAGRFDLKTVWQGIASGPKMQFATFQDITNLFLHLRLVAHEVFYGNIHVFDADGNLTIKPGEVALQPSSFTYIGGKTTAEGSITASNQNLMFRAHANLVGGNMAETAKLLGAKGMISGKFNIAADLHMSGKILDQALQHNSKGGLVFMLNQGVIQKNILEKASVDLRTLLRRSNADVPINCMVAVVDIHNGIGKITPLRLVTPDETLLGGGQLNLMRQRLDMVIKSNAATSGFFALDIPISISGPFSNIGVAPAISTNMNRLQLKNVAIPQDLSPDLQQLAAQSHCVK